MSFLDHFAGLPDPRSHINRTYDLLDVVFLSVCAVLSGAEGWTDIKKFGDKKLDWLRKFRFENGIPVDDTIARIISSHAPNAAFIAEAIRSHWEVENKTHWVLDVVYKEDDSRIRRNDGAQNVGLIRRLCMSLARLHLGKDSMRGKLKAAGWDDDYCEELVFGINA